MNYLFYNTNVCVCVCVLVCLEKVLYMKQVGIIMHRPFKTGL